MRIARIPSGRATLVGGLVKSVRGAPIAGDQGFACGGRDRQPSGVRRQTAVGPYWKAWRVYGEGDGK